MRILAISDTPERLLYDDFNPERWRHRVDLAISCGDLDHEYLEFLVTVLNVPLLYVAGNHDASYRSRPPEGCEDIDGRVVRIGGLRIGGIHGSLRYNAGPEQFQYTERQMAHKARRLALQAWRVGGLDVVVSHATPVLCPAFTRCPTPAGAGRPCAHRDLSAHSETCLDAADLAHRGVVAFRRFIVRRAPRYWLHGQNHLSYSWSPRVSSIGATTVINAYGHYLLDTEARPTVLPVVAAPSTLLRPS